MATFNITVNASSTSQSPTGNVSKADTINFVSGTTPPSQIHFKPSGLFGHDAVSVPSSQTVQSNANGTYTIYAGASSTDDLVQGGTAIGTIIVSG